MQIVGLIILAAILYAIFASKPDPPYNPELICPHCQVKGKIKTKTFLQKKGISGAKATGAIFTVGLSMLATGLSRKENVTEAHCDNCGSTWYY